mgnify:CR=1 FL=1
MSKKFGAPGSVESFGLRQEETMSDAEKVMVTEKAVEAMLGNAEERDSAKKQLFDFLGTEQKKKDLLKWALKDRHFKGIVSLCEKYTGKESKVELVRNLVVFGVTDKEVIDNLFSVIFDGSESYSRRGK